MQRRLRNTLAIAIAGGALLIGAGTAVAATPGDEVVSNVPQVDAPLDQVGAAGEKANSDTLDQAEGAEKQLNATGKHLETSADRLDADAPELPKAPVNGVPEAPKTLPDAPKAPNGLPKAPVEAPEVPNLQK